MNLEQWFSENAISLLVPIISAFLAIIFGRERVKMEIEKGKNEAKKILVEAEKLETEKDSITTDAANKAVMLWQELYAELQKNNDGLKKEFEDKINELESEIDYLKRSLQKCRRCIRILLRHNDNQEAADEVTKIIGIEGLEDLLED